MSLTRKLVVPSVLIAAAVAGVVAYAAWESVRQTRALERSTHAVRAASALALALHDAAQEEDRAVLSLRARPGPVEELRLAQGSEHVAEVARGIGDLALAPHAAAIWVQFTESRAALVGIRDAIVKTARGGDGAALERELARWRLMSTRGEALLKDFAGYHLRYLDRTVAELQERRVRALRTTVAGALLGLAAAAVLTFAFGRAVVRPIIAAARTAEHMADTGRPETVGGAEREDEIGVLARSFNRMTEQLFAANAKLEASDRNKDEFLGMLSHELRNPLAPLRNSLHILDRVDPASASATRAREVMKRQLAHLTRLVDDLLDVTRIARGKIELRCGPVDLGELVRRCVEDHAALARDRGQDLHVEAPAAGTLRIDGDEARLAQVLGNLLHNATKFTPAGGTIAVSARGDAGSAEIRVRDTGQGIEAQLLARVFEPFTQAKQTLARTEGGLGLGLSLVKGIVELHGGTVVAESEGHGRGAEFVVRLPADRTCRARTDGATSVAQPA